MVNGRRYTVLGSAEGYTQRGEASWYGPQFHGKLTANGEVYDMEKMTAAHRTLPFGSLVRVTNTRNGRSIKLRINDRGPYVGKRVIDVSKGAAEKLDFIHAGLAPVRVEVVGHAGFRRLKN